MTSVLSEAAALPILDAAYALWRRRRQLDAMDRSQAGEARPLADGATFEAMKKLIPGALQALRHERDNPQEGPTLTRLRLAHPEARETELEAAIKAAVKLEMDCQRHFSYKSPRYLDDVEEAVRLARLDNPGFGEISYRRLFDDLAFAMR